MKKLLQEAILEHPYLCDGAMGTQLMLAGLEQGNCGEEWNAAHPERVLLLCWPPFDDDAASYAPLRAYQGDALLYIGDLPGPDGTRGATGTTRFHRELALNWTPAEQAALPNWPGLADRLVVYRRNAGRRPLTERDRCHDCRRYLPTGAIGRCDRCFRQRPPAMALR